jgi:hypothetical protein
MAAKEAHASCSGLACLQRLSLLQERGRLFGQARPDVSHLQQDGPLLRILLQARPLEARLGEAPIGVTSVHGSFPHSRR